MKHWSRWTEQDCKAIYDALHADKPALTDAQIEQLEPGKTFASIMSPQELVVVGWMTALGHVRDCLKITVG